MPLKALSTLLTVTNDFHLRSRSLKPLMLGIKEYGEMVLHSVQKGIQNLATYLRLDMITVGKLKDEARCPIPESFPIK